MSEEAGEEVPQTKRQVRKASLKQKLD